MSPFTLPFLATAAFAGLLATARGETLFQDDFESGLDWTTGTTQQGRAAITSQHGPTGGNFHLVLDDTTSDAVFSVAEASFILDLSNRKNVVLGFMAKSLGNDAHPPPSGNFTTTRNYDGVAISTDDGVTWRSVQSLASLTTEWAAFSVTLDSSVASLGGGFGPGFRIRFSAYDNAPAPLDGIAIDNVTVSGDVEPRITLEVPGTVNEGSGPHNALVSLNVAPAAPVTMALSSSSSAITLPPLLVIPAGETSASFEFSAPEDSLVTLTRTATITANAPGFVVSPGSVAVVDNEAPQAALVLPAQVTEGISAFNNATLSMDRTASVPLVVSLSALPANELTLPTTVTVPAGQSQVNFTVTATNDSRIDGNLPVSVAAFAPGLTPVLAATTTVDNEPITLSITVPSFILESKSGTGTVTIPGTLTFALPVSLSVTSEAGLTVTSLVIIPPGSTQASFNLSAADNATIDGTRSSTVQATAEGFTTGTKTAMVRDNDAGSYRFSAPTDLVALGSPVAITVTVVDSADNPISGFTGSVTLDLLQPDGTALPVTPATATFAGTGTGWAGNVTLPHSSATGLRLRATDALGNVGLSSPFDPMRVLPLMASDLLWNPLRNVIYASVAAGDPGPYASQVVEMDPASGQVVRSVPILHDPGQIVMTSGCEFVYVAQKGNGQIVKIDTATLTVSSSFAVGFDQFGGTAFAGDMCTVVGQPNLVIVSKRRSASSTASFGVGVFDNGVERAVKTQEHTDTVRIEPTIDPTVYFCTTANAIRRLKLAADGISVLSSNSALWGYEVRADGNRAYGTSGDVFDTTALSKPGVIASQGPVWPDVASNRVYFVEKIEPSNSTYNRLGSYDAQTFSMVRRSSMTAIGTVADSLIRWGGNGLAFRSASHLYLVNSASLVPASPPANLAVTVTAAPVPVMTGQPLIYTVTLTNQGPNLARDTVLATTLSAGQTLQTAFSSSGTPTISGLVVTLPPANLASGATVTLTLTAVPQAAGSVSCSAKAVSDQMDPDFSNNHGIKMVSAGYLTATDSINQIELPANSLISDPVRQVLWATIPSSVDEPLQHSVVSIDPLTGIVSAPIPLGAAPYERCIALSGNGRYLYVGLANLAEFCRIDLEQTPPVVTRVPLGNNFINTARFAEDIEVLDGDGLSVLVATIPDRVVQVIDDLTSRPVRTTTNIASCIERTATPGIFAGYNAAITSHPATRLSVTASGVQVVQTVTNLLPQTIFSSDLRGAGDLMLTNGGLMYNAATLSLVATLPRSGTACHDGQHQRAYFVNTNTLYSFDTTTGTATGTLPLPVSPLLTSRWAVSCVRWGIDGIAFMGNGIVVGGSSPEKIFIARWSQVIPSDTDGNGDGISDAWAAALFATINVEPEGDGDHDSLPDALEYLFATSPVTPSASPLQSSVFADGPQRTFLLRFPRRAGLAAGSYGFELSADAQEWIPAEGVVETVISTATVDGIAVENVQAWIPMAWPERGFARIKWQHP